LTTDEAGVLDRVRSVSYIAALPEERQRRADEQVLELLGEHGLNSSGRPIEFPYVTEAYVLRRRELKAKCAAPSVTRIDSSL